MLDQADWFLEFPLNILKVRFRNPCSVIDANDWEKNPNIKVMI